jgi:hypothetical protein
MICGSDGVLIPCELGKVCSHDYPATGTYLLVDCPATKKCDSFTSGPTDCAAGTYSA